LSSEITLVLGGSRSGKSAFAERLARDAGQKPVIYIATAEAGDDEMAERIAAHKARRPSDWETWEGDLSALPEETRKLAARGGVLLLDSLTTYLSSAFFTSGGADEPDEKKWRAAEEAIIRRAVEIFSAFRETARDGARFITVSDEAGCGVVPAYQSGRRFRDLLGSANQRAAAAADGAVLVAAGIPLWLKRKDARNEA
jgi:adenosylcobinamide kinase/adenosylcobinamide-phosphate guanylyltransferase